MKHINLGRSGLLASEIALGCMRMDSLSQEEAGRVIEQAHDCGVNLFEHADIYGGGASEQVFAAAMKKTSVARDQIIIQSKCGIRKDNGPKRYDFSKEYILSSVNGILKRMDIDYLDILALHRPDALMEPEDVAEAFDSLHRSGKVRYFGVSNHNSFQLELLSQALNQKIIVNQMQFSPVHTGMIDCGIHVNMKTPNSVHHDGMLLDYCRLNNITIQAWSPFRPDLTSPVYLGHADYVQLTEEIRKIAKDKGITDSAVVISWILRHPAKIQALIGSMNPKRIKDMCQAASNPLTREEWYSIYAAAGNTMP